MKRIMIFGAGQAGRMAAKWLPSGSRPVAFIDNNKALQGTKIDGIPVLNLEDALPEMPERIVLAVLNREAAEEIRNTLKTSGYRGDISDVTDIRALMDLRLAALRLYSEQIRLHDVPGDIAELGVYRGEFAAELNRIFPDRELYLFDTFEGFDDRDLMIEKKIAPDGRNALKPQDFSDTGIDPVRERLPHPERAHFIRGRFPDSLKEASITDSFALVSLDADLYEPTRAGLAFFYPRLSNGGIILIHDYNSAQYPGVRRAVDDFCKEQRILPVPIADLHGTALVQKPGSIV